MKRLLALILVLSMAAAWLLLPVQAVPTSGTAGENITWSFDETAKQITVTGTGPMDLGDYPKWSDLRSKVCSVVIEEGVTSVDYRAFSNFQQLHTVTLPPSVKTIEGNAFNNCYQLKNISLEHITTLGNYSFSGCSSLESLTVPAAVTEIPYGAFSDCRNLQSVQFHNQLVRIDDYAFNGCRSLTKIQIPDSVTEIDSFAFYNCSGLTDVDLGNGITALSTRVLEGCSKLEAIRIPDNVTSIGMGALSNCSSLKEVYLGAGVSDIEVDAFWKDVKLKAFSISNKNQNFSVVEGVLYTKDRKELVLFPYGFTGAYTVLSETTAIREHAGYECGITALTIPGNVKIIGKYAFAWCEDLVTLRLAEGVQELQTGAFSCTGLKKVTIPASVTLINQRALDCGEMKQMIIHGDPPTINYAFPYVDFTVFYPKKTKQWLAAHDLYGGLPTWELQCTTHSYANGACSRCGTSDPKAADLIGRVSAADNNDVNVQIFAQGKTAPLFEGTLPVGNYLLPEMLPGSYTLLASAEGCAPREYTFKITSGAQTQDLTLQAFGDLNGDGKWNMGEISRIYSHIRGTVPLSGYTLACADVNANGSVNMGDIATLYAQIRGT